MMKKLAYRELLEKYDWSKIALQTVEEYERAIGLQAAPGPVRRLKDDQTIYDRYHLTGNFPEERG